MMRRKAPVTFQKEGEGVKVETEKKVPKGEEVGGEEAGGAEEVEGVEEEVKEVVGVEEGEEVEEVKEGIFHLKGTPQ